MLDIPHLALWPYRVIVLVGPKCPFCKSSVPSVFQRVLFLNIFVLCISKYLSK